MKRFFSLLLRVTPIIAIIIVGIYYHSIIYYSLLQLVQIKVSTIVLLTVLYTVVWGLKGLKWKLILNTEEFSSIHLANIILLGNFTSLFVPAKSGDLVRLKLATSSQLSKSEILSSTLMDRVWDLFGIISSLLLLFMVYHPFDIIQTNLYFIAIVVIITGFITIYAVLPNYTANIVALVPDRFKPISRKFQRGLIITRKRDLPLIAILSTIIWFFEGALLILIFNDFSYSIPWWIIIFAVLVANVTKVFPITPGGFVIYEATIAYIISQLTSLPFIISIEFGVLDSIFKNGYTTILGIFSYYYWFIHRDKQPDENSD